MEWTNTWIFKNGGRDSVNQMKKEECISVNIFFCGAIDFKVREALTHRDFNVRCTVDDVAYLWDE